MALTTFTSGQVLTAAQLNAVQANDYNQTVSTKTASYTLVAADKGTRVVMNSASATTITVNTSLFSAGDTLVLQNIGAGVCTVTAGTATVSSAGPLAIPQYGSGTLYFTSAGVSVFFPSAGPAASSGLTFISSTTVTGSQVNITNCFSATYESYLIIGRNITGPGDGSAFDFRLGVGGTPNTADDYLSASPDAAYGSGTYVTLGQCGTGDVNNFQMQITAPQLAQQTFYTMSYQHVYLTGGARIMNGYHETTTQFTDFVLLVRSGASDFTQGNIKIYGYAAS